MERKLEVEKKRRTNYLIKQLSNNLHSDINEFKNDRPVVQRFGEKDKMAKRERVIIIICLHVNKIINYF